MGKWAGLKVPPTLACSDKHGLWVTLSRGRDLFEMPTVSILPIGKHEQPASWCLSSFACRAHIGLYPRLTDSTPRHWFTKSLLVPFLTRQAPKPWQTVYYTGPICLSICLVHLLSQSPGGSQILVQGWAPAEALLYCLNSSRSRSTRLQQKIAPL